MKRALVDPSMLAAPPNDASDAEIEAYLYQLLQLDTLEKCDCVGLTISTQAIEVLTRADAYPILDRYPKKRFPQRADVLRIVFGLAQRLPHLEDLIGFSELLASATTCDPPPIATNWNPILEQHFQYLCASIALSAYSDDSRILGVVIVASDHEYSQCLASGTVLDVEWSAPDPSLAAKVEFPLPFSITVLVVRNAAGLAGCPDIPQTLWIETSSFEWALKIFLHQRSLGQAFATWPPREFSWRFGPQFAASLQRHGFSTNGPKVGALLRALAEVVLEGETAKSHALRVNRHGSSPQLIRASDGAKAMRHDIGYEYHLHYWRTPSGPEFSAVVMHNDYSIAD